jgi:hypothetical protein
MYVEFKKVTELVDILEVVDRTEENRRERKSLENRIVEYSTIFIRV